MRQESELRAYQQRIIKHLYEHDEALCVVRPGGGKTISALTAFKELRDNGIVRQALVIAPKRVANNVWPDELAQWAHVNGMRYVLLTGSPTKRAMLLANARSADLIVVGIDNVGWLIEQLDGWSIDAPIFDLLIIDEISKLRNPTGVRAKLLAKHGRRWKMRWGLSGTLRPNGPQDLFMPTRVVTQGKLWGKSFYAWHRERFYPTDFQGYDWKPKPGEEDKMNEEIAPYVVTLRDDEYPQLPQLSVVLDYVDLPSDVRQTYLTMQKKLFARVDGKTIAAANAAVATGKLAQMANGFVYNFEEENHTTFPTSDELHDEKRDWLQDIIDGATGPTLLIYEYQHDLKMISELLPGIPYIGAGSGDAIREIEHWNEGRLPFLALHPAAGGHGLNLQAGGCDMAWIAPCWSPEFWEQTIARLHRSGQTKPVIVRVCVARNTVDELKLDRVHFKMDAQKAFEKYLASTQKAH